MALVKILAVTTIFLSCWEPVYTGYLEDVCMRAMSDGQSCSEAPAQLQYFFSTEREECIPFLYKGCGGNENRFTLQDDCTDACQIDWFKKKNKKNKNKTLEDNEVSEIRKSDCALEAVRGPCKALIKQWYFNGKSGKCESFIYGGCNGNKNRFNTDTQCKAVCGK